MPRFFVVSSIMIALNDMQKRSNVPAVSLQNMPTKTIQSAGEHFIQAISPRIQIVLIFINAYRHFKTRSLKTFWQDNFINLNDKTHLIDLE